MVFQSIKKRLSRNILNIPGWRTNRKIVVIESDDWGSIRMPSRETYERLEKKGVKLNNSLHNKFDSLETEEDLSALFETLIKFKDKNGRSPVITANTILTNPDFKKIKQANFKEYHFELFTETLKNLPGHQSVFNIIKQGINEGVYFPQFHGREHINPDFWMKALKDNDLETKIAFDHGVVAHSSKWAENNKVNFLSALDFHSDQELFEQKTRIIDGISLFQQLFKYNSKSFIAPRYIWSPLIEPVLKKNGIDYIQGTAVQLIPRGNGLGYKKKINYTGKLNKLGQHYVTRNIFFEPALKPGFNWLGDAINRMRTSFYWGKPAVICSHRLNYIGSIKEKNRRINLNLLFDLLTKMLEYWPNIEFMSTAELGDIMKKQKNNDC